MKLFLSSLGGVSEANPPDTTVPSGSPSVSIISDNLLIANEPSQPNRWYGRPTLKVMPDGNWIMVYANSESHHLLVYSQLHVRFSDDYGETWTDENTDLDGNAVSGFPMYPPGAVPGVDSEGPGESWIYVCPNGDLLVHMWKVRYGQTKNGSYQSRSTDMGKTWSTPEYIDFIGSNRDDYIYSTDDDFVLNGVIYAGAREYEFIKQQEGIKSLFIKSEDNGVTWEVVSDVTDYYNYPSNEVGFEYVIDNGTPTVVAFTRGTDEVSGGIYPASYKSYSTDMGQTWTTPDADPNIQVHGRIRLYTRSHLKRTNNWWLDPVMIAHGFETVNPPASKPRRIAIWVSKDFGQTWTGPLHLRIQGEDGGYGDVLYNPAKGEYVSLQYYAPTSLYDGEIRQINWKLNWT